MPLCDNPGHDHGVGVRPGDQVVAIEGRAGTNVTYCDIERLGRQKDRLQVVVRRNGVLLTNTVPVWEDRFSF